MANNSRIKRAAQILALATALISPTAARAQEKPEPLKLTDIQNKKPEPPKPYFESKEYSDPGFEFQIAGNFLYSKYTKGGEFFLTFPINQDYTRSLAVGFSASFGSNQQSFEADRRAYRLPPKQVGGQPRDGYYITTVDNANDRVELLGKVGMGFGDIYSDFMITAFGLFGKAHVKPTETLLTNTFTLNDGTIDQKTSYTTNPSDLSSLVYGGGATFTKRIAENWALNLGGEVRFYNKSEAMITANGVTLATLAMGPAHDYGIRVGVTYLPGRR